MKSLFISAAIALTAIAAIGGGYYAYLQNSNALVTIMYDITDTIQPTKDTSAIPTHIANYTSEWGETNIRFLTICDFAETKPFEVFIPAQFPLVSNPYDREAQLQDANKSIAQSISKFSSLQAGRKESIIFKPIVNELNRLSSLSAHTKELVVFSDLQENDSKGFSVYKPSDSILIHSDTQKAQELFEKQVKIKNLKGITIYLVYDAPTPASQNGFLLMAHIWESIFIKSGADKVVIGPDFPTH